MSSDTHLAIWRFASEESNVIMQVIRKSCKGFHVANSGSAQHNMLKCESTQSLSISLFDSSIA
jgi:hypothetical protein